MKEELIYLFAGYMVIWTAIFVYTLTLGGRQKRLEAEIDLLKQAAGRR